MKNNNRKYHDEAISHRATLVRIAERKRADEDERLRQKELAELIILQKQCFSRGD